MMSNTAQTRNFEVISPSRPMRGANPAAPSVLVWDDDPATAMQLQRVFKMHGCTTMAVNFGNEAYLGLRNQEFDLIVMDYQLSLVDARRALEGVPEWVRLSTPFVLISSADRASEARQLGFSAFYVKPVLVETAQDILKRFTGYSPNCVDDEGGGSVLEFPLSERAHAAFGY